MKAMTPTSTATDANSYMLLHGDGVDPTARTATDAVWINAPMISREQSESPRR
jgi:hypothetical protein